MWGDPERALRLDPSDSLSTTLFQIAGPGHIPWQDPVWQELLHGYNVWVHVEMSSSAAAAASGAKMTIIERACQSMAQHAPRSSNLAALTMHVTRMLRDLIPLDNQSDLDESEDVRRRIQQQQQQDAVTAFSNRIALVGKSRATAGALNLLRILIHSVMQLPDDEAIANCFLYKSREDGLDAPATQNTAPTLLHALMYFIVHAVGPETTSPETSQLIPEIYDATVLALDLLLVLFSPQLYRPMESSFQVHLNKCGVFWDLIMDPTTGGGVVSPRRFLSTLLNWTIQRPPAPDRSIAYHTYQLAQSVVTAKGERVGPDGMYETSLVVNAASSDFLWAGADERQLHSAITPASLSKGKGNIILDATKGVLVLSSNIILLPFRLVSLALGLWGHRKERGYDEVHKNYLQSSLKSNSRTKDLLWLSESPLADLAAAVMLLLANNRRSNENHPYRKELIEMTDTRWEGGDLPDLPSARDAVVDEESRLETIPLMSPPGHVKRKQKDESLLINYEELFSSFGRTGHTEIGALLLYTVMQASKNFAESLAARSDLDTLVIPLLRTLYFSSSVRFFAAQDYTSKAIRRPSNESHSTTALSIRNCPFRSSSQLYVIIILLLLFSQDPSFGSDAFRRTMVTNILWYKERNLRDINLGSIMILILLRLMIFNLNRLHDAFLLSNCCAVLMNLSTSVIDLHDYAAMRLVAVTVSAMKRYTLLMKENPQAEEDETSLTAMQGEITRTLLRLLKTCLGPKSIERNLQLVYALMYHQTDIKRILSTKECPFRKKEVSRIKNIIGIASAILEESQDARTASKALKVLASNVERIKEAVQHHRRRGSDSEEDFTFSYEEEADPETFFVPYVWEVIVCSVTATTIEWNKNQIQVFQLLDDEETTIEFLNGNGETDDLNTIRPQQLFSKELSDVV